MNIGEITVKINLTDEDKEAIRQIVREEIAAQRERLTKNIGPGPVKNMGINIGDIYGEELPYCRS